MTVRRSPSEIYLRYLIVSPQRYADDQIRAIVKAHGLDFIGMPYLKRLRSMCIPPTPFYPEDVTHAASHRFLRKERLLLLFHPDKSMEQAKAILEYPRAKELTESMLIARSEPEWIARNLRKAGFEITPSGVAQYKFHYFNVDLVDGTELRTLLALRNDTASTDDRDEMTLSGYRDKAAKLDSRVLTANAQIGPMAAVANQLRLGVLPSNIEVGRLVAATRTAAVAAALEAILNGWAQASREYATTAKMMTEILEAVGVAEKDLQASLTGLALATATEEIPHLDQLSGGEHTIDMQPMKLAAELPAAISEAEVVVLPEEIPT